MLALVLALVLARGLASVVPAQASAPRGGQIFGIEDQQSLAIFTDARLLSLHPRSVRLVIRWSRALVPGGQRHFTDVWYADALKAGLAPLIAFGTSDHRAPSPADYERGVQAAISRWPRAAFQAWNEANHESEPTYDRPELAAAYASILRRACSGNRCVFLPITVLLYSPLAKVDRWVARFVKAYRYRPHIWALHTYADANSLNYRLMWAFMRRWHPDHVWVTETGAWWQFLPTFGPSATRQMAAAAHVLDPFRDPRVDRLYYYQWLGTAVDARWDTGLLDADGTPRPAYTVLAGQLGAAQPGSGR